MLNILQSSVHYSTLGDYGYDGSYTLAIILMVVVGVLGFFVQARLQSVTRRYSAQLSPQGLTGREIAEKMLHDHGIYNVKVTHVSGHLTDHFNPVSMTVNLSDSVYNSRSITAAAVAAHECGHAVQHATGYAPVRLRSQLVPIVNFASAISTWVIVLGIALMSFTGSALLCWIGIALIAMSAIFAIVTLPVEYNASNRAIAWLQRSGMLQQGEVAQAREALDWAARTYLVAALSAIATLLYYVALIKRRK
ncbi:MAG: zinc metallopeptidase [Alistipes sp.]|jgi:Zn-dependent membrane protease YugP|nr:zinc metallopeptidase [Alistipes sp.]